RAIAPRSLIVARGPPNRRSRRPPPRSLRRIPTGVRLGRRGRETIAEAADLGRLTLDHSPQLVHLGSEAADLLLDALRVVAPAEEQDDQRDDDQRAAAELHLLGPRDVSHWRHPERGKRSRDWLRGLRTAPYQTQAGGAQ